MKKEVLVEIYKIDNELRCSTNYDDNQAQQILIWLEVIKKNIIDEAAKDTLLYGGDSYKKTD